jgi:hypothetical protein
VLAALAAGLAVGLAFAALALTLYRPLFGRPPRMGSGDDRS